MDKEKLLNYYKDDLYGNLRKQQKTDETYYDDTFAVPWILPPLQVSRVGAGKKIVDRPVHQITSSELVAYRNPAKKKDGTITQTAQASSNNVTRMINDVWIPILMQYNPNPLHQFVKDQFIYGEGWLQVIHNAKMVDGDRRGLPFHIINRNPLIIYASPNEDEKGIPEEVIVYYERMPWVVKTMYPSWEDPKRKLETEHGGTVTWMENWTSTKRYFEADGEKILKDTTNPYGFVPFTHKIAGFGKSSSEGKMEDMIVGYLRQHRDLIDRLTSSTSDIDSAIHLYANYSLTVQPEQRDIEIPDDFEDNFVLGPGNLHKLPFGLKVNRMVDILPSSEVLTWNYKLQSDLGMEVPPALLGLSSGTSGRMQDMTYAGAMKFFKHQVRNSEYAFGTAMGMALRMCEGIPNLYPDELKPKDINGDYEVIIKLHVDDPVERDRKINAGRALYASGLVDLHTFLIDYAEYTDEEAEEIEDNIAVEKVMQSEIFATIIGTQVAEEQGILDKYAQLQQMGKGGGQAAQPPVNYGSQGGEPRNQNIQTQLGNEMADMSFVQGGTRRSAR